MGLFLTFTLFLENVQMPYVTWSRKKKWHVEKYPVFKVFPVSDERRNTRSLKSSRE
jgi:ABC-type branched-subunit amino acid transport system ATPase component